MDARLTLRRVLLLALTGLGGSTCLAVPATEVLVDRCASAAGWTLNLGREFPGASGKLGVAEAGGRTCVRVDFDFSAGGRYAGAERGCSLTGVTEIAFWLKATAGGGGLVRLRDMTNQEHAAGFQLKPGTWQHVRLPVTPDRFGSHWGGANDGGFHFPLRRILVAVGNPGAGHFLLRDLTVRTTDPSLQWQVTLTTPLPGNVVFPEESPAPITLRVLNGRKHEWKTTVEYTVTHYTGQVVLRGSEHLSFGPWQERRLTFRLPGTRLGYYQVAAEVRVGQRSVAETTGGVCFVTRPVDLGRDDPDSFFGLHAGEPDAAARIGVKWNRQTRAWWWGEGTPGHFYWPDTAIEESRRHGIEVMLTLEYRPPSWVKEELAPGESLWPPPEKLMRGWRRYVRACARRYRDQVAVFEIQNEPDLTLWRHDNLSFGEGVASYVRIARAAGEVLREEAPQHPLAGVDVSGGEYRTGMRYVRAVLQQAGDLFQIFTGHPYASPRYFGPGLRPWFPHENRLVEKLRLSQRLLRELGGKQRVWIGEKGWGLSVREPPLGEYSRAYTCCVAQALITARSVAGVEKYFWFLQQGCNEKGFEYGLWRGAPSQPLPAAAAYATCARFLRHARPLRTLRLSDSLRGFSFVRGERKQGVAAVWAVEDAVKLNLPAMTGLAVWDLMGNRRQENRVVLTKAPLFLTVPKERLESLCRALEREPVLAVRPLHVESVFLTSVRSLTARVVNRSRTRLPVSLRAFGTAGQEDVPPDNRPHDLTLPLREAVLAHTGSAFRVELLVAGKPVVRRELELNLLRCPRRTPKLDGKVTGWGKPMVVDQRSQVLPPDPNVGWTGPEDLSAAAWWCYDDSSFYLTVRVRDETHSTPALGAGNFWNSDSLQVAIDPDNDAGPADGFDEDDVEIGCVLTRGGPRVFMTAPVIKPLRLACHAHRRGKDTVYQLAVPWSLLGVSPLPGKVFSFNFIVNDNDGQGRAYWMGPRPGIGEGKRPGMFLDLWLAEP